MATKITKPQEAALDAAAASIESVLSGDLIGSLSHSDLVAFVIHNEKVRRLFDAASVRAAHEVAVRSRGNDSLAEAHGFKNARSFLQALTLAPGSEISARLRLGAAVAPVISETGEVGESLFPVVAQALDTGEIGMAAAGAIVNNLSKVDSHVTTEMVKTAESNLVGAAQGSIPTCDETSGTVSNLKEIPVHADNLRTLAGGWLEHLNSTGHPPVEEQEAKRYFYIGRQQNGLVPVKGLLLPDVASKLGRVIDAITNPRAKKRPTFTPAGETGESFADEGRGGGAGDGTAECAGGGAGEGVNCTGGGSGVNAESKNGDEELQVVDPRTPDQLRHDAVAIAIGFALKNEEMPNLNGEAASLVVQIDQSELTKQHGTAWIEDAHGEITPIHAGIARHASCVGGVTRVTQNEKGKIVDLGTNNRIFNAAQRKAILSRDGGCLIPGCKIPSSWCEVHHVKEHQNGGETHTDNGVLLCWYHHRNIEQNGWSVRMNDGTPEVRAPKWMDPEGKWRKHRPLHKVTHYDGVQGAGVQGAGVPRAGVPREGRFIKQAAKKPV